MKGKQPNRDTYVRAWKQHINEIANLALAADIPYHEYREMKDQLETWLNLAVNYLYHINKESENGQ